MAAPSLARWLRPAEVGRSLLYVLSGLNSIAVPQGFHTVPSALAHCFPAHPTDQPIPAFIPDEVRGSATATRHLIERGCRRFVFLGDPTTPESALRLRGHQQELAEARSRHQALSESIGAAREALADTGAWSAENVVSEQRKTH